MASSLKVHTAQVKLGLNVIFFTSLSIDLKEMRESRQQNKPLLWKQEFLFRI